MSTLRVDTITDEAGTGPVEFTNGINVSGGTVTGLDPFKYNAVSGATQALDVGSYNFFDGGTLTDYTADTTVSFINVPTEARWTYTAKAGNIGYILENATYVRSFSVSAQETTPTGLFFKPDGTVMYVIGYVGDYVNEYSLSTAWDISTASYVRRFSTGAQDAYPSDVFFKSDGTAMYMCGFNSDYVNEYSLSTAWNVTTASYVQRFSVLSQGQNPMGMFFKPDGTTMYVATGTSTVFEYSLSIAWNVTTASYVRGFNASAQGTSILGVSFNSDGTAMFITGDADAVFEYSLSTAWNVTTASYVRSFSVSGQETAPQGLFFKTDGTAMYLVGTGSDAVLEYQTEGSTPISFPSSIQNPPTETPTVAGDRVSYTFFTADGGTNVYLINEEVL